MVGKARDELGAAGIDQFQRSCLANSLRLHLFHLCHSYPLLGVFPETCNLSSRQAAFPWPPAAVQLRCSFKIVQGHERSKFSLQMTCNKIRSWEVQVTISL